MTVPRSQYYQVQVCKIRVIGRSPEGYHEVFRPIAQIGNPPVDKMDIFDNFDPLATSGKRKTDDVKQKPAPKKKTRGGSYYPRRMQLLLTYFCPQGNSSRSDHTNYFAGPAPLQRRLLR